MRVLALLVNQLLGTAAFAYALYLGMWSESADFERAQFYLLVAIACELSEARAWAAWRLDGMGHKLP